MISTSISGSEFDGLFDRFVASSTSTWVFRYEGVQTCDVPDVDAGFEAFRHGGPQPVRSVLTDPWLARIARSVLAKRPKGWVRVRYVAEPVSTYTEWELGTHALAQTVGDEMLVTTEPVDEVDYWLFHGDRPGDQHAVLIDYDSHGAPTRFGYLDDPREVRRLAGVSHRLMAAAEPLNSYLARRREVLGAH